MSKVDGFDAECVGCGGNLTVACGCVVNADDGVTAVVRARDDGRWGVTLRDDDSGLTVPVVHIFRRWSDAAAKALEIAG